MGPSIEAEASKWRTVTSLSKRTCPNPTPPNPCVCGLCRSALVRPVMCAMPDCGDVKPPNMPFVAPGVDGVPASPPPLPGRCTATPSRRETYGQYPKAVARTMNLKVQNMAQTKYRKVVEKSTHREFTSRKKKRV